MDEIKYNLCWVKETRYPPQKKEGCSEQRWERRITGDQKTLRKLSGIYASISKAFSCILQTYAVFICQLHINKAAQKTVQQY